MNFTLIFGFIFATILIIGAAWPATKNKNKLFALGNLGMFIYAILNYQSGGAIFFIFLESLVIISTILMLAKVKDLVSSIILLISGLGFIIWSISLFEDYTTTLFIIGLTILSLGFALKNGSIRREIAFALGSLILLYFSYLDSAWIFVYINFFFTIFSLYHLFKHLQKSSTSHPDNHLSS